jgi:3-methylcrotonyl-CoA carboxylase alpha subunit
VRIELFQAHERLAILCEPRGQGARITLVGSAHEIGDAVLDGGRIRARIDGASEQAGFERRAGELHLFADGTHAVFRTAELGSNEAAETDAAGLKSPMPGQVIQVLVAAGAPVKRGQPLMIVEAMKMEHTIVAPHDGVVESVAYTSGERVEEGAQLLRVKPSSGT